MGKSTFAAALVRSQSALNVATRTQTAGSDGSLGAAQPQRALGRRVTAWHFCKHTHAAFRDPIRMIKSIAYQLGVELPELRKAS